MVATLRIAEHIADGVADLDALAAVAGCDADALGSVLHYLVSRGVFQESRPAEFGLNDAARGLLDPSVRLGLDLEGIGGRMAYAWSTLLTYVRTGAPAYQELFGLPFWEDLDAHPQIAASFDALMGPADTARLTPRCSSPADWESVRSVVDVGGGTGALLAEILRARPAVHGTLVDLPRRWNARARFSRPPGWPTA